MDDIIEQIYELMQKAAGMADGVAQTEVIEEAIGLADATQDDRLQFTLRLSLAQSAFNSGQLEKTIVAVAWCFGKQDASPDRFDYSALLDVCTFAMNSLSSLPQFSKSQVNTLLDDMESRYRQAGFSLRAVYRARCFNSLWMGDRELAENYYSAMQRCELDSWEDPEWIALFDADYLMQLGCREEAFALAEPMLRGGDDGSGVFSWLASFMLLPMLELGETELAEASFRRAWPQIRDNPNFAECVGHGLLYLVALGRDEEAGAGVAECLHWAFEAPMLRESFELALSAWAYFRRLRKLGQTSWRGRLPASAPNDDAEGYPIAEVEQWLSEFVEASAVRFDNRNENAHFAGMIDSRLRYAEPGWRT